MLNVIMLSFIRLSVVMQNVIKMSVFMPSVVGPTALLAWRYWESISNILVNVFISMELTKASGAIFTFDFLHNLRMGPIS